MTQDIRHELHTATNGTNGHVNGSSHHPQKNGFANGTNGHASPINGVSPARTNGIASSKARRRAPDFYGHDREEVTRLLIQALGDLGYNEAAERLSQESEYQVESPTVAAFRSAVLQGKWSTAEALLFGHKPHPDEGGVSITREETTHCAGLRLCEDADPHQMKFLIREQKYRELLRRNLRGQALMVLQSELQPLNHDTRRLNMLSGLMVSDNTESLNWNAVLEKRQRLLAELSKSVSPSAMIPEHRLAELLNQVHQGQISRCLYHNPIGSSPPSLLIDHVCDPNDFPLRTSLELSHNEDEVYYVDFSHNGKYLVSCGKSTTVIIYETQNFEVKYRLSEHGKSVVYACWSPDDSKLITCCQDSKARIWDLTNARCIQTIDHHSLDVTTAAWTPGGNFFVTGALDRENNLFLRSTDGGQDFPLPGGFRTRDCAITPDGQKLIVMSSENYITVYDLTTRKQEYSIKVSHYMTCLSVSRDSRTMLINMENDEIHLIEIETADIVRRYKGHQQDGFIIRSIFGGTDEGLVISGSSNSKIHIWHKLNGTLIETLEGHSEGCVSSVSWNPAHSAMFASGGDDRKVRIWTKDPQPSSILQRRISSQSSRRQSNYERGL